MQSVNGVTIHAAGMGAVVATSLDSLVVLCIKILTCKTEATHAKNLNNCSYI